MLRARFYFAMDIPQEKFEKFKEIIRQEYDVIKEIHCPYFNETVKFSSDGFQHLLYKGSSKIKQRGQSEQYMRLKLLKLAPKLLRLTKTVQEFHKGNQFVVVKKNKRREMVMKEVKYWGFIAIIDDRKIKVVVKQIGDGFKRFWSIIPNWTTRKSREMFSRVQYSGDLEND